MASAPRPGASRRAEEAAQQITISVDGEKFTLYPAEITAEHAGLLRKATGMGLREFFVTLGASRDIDTWAAFVFLARLQRGEAPVFAAVAASITWGSEIADAEPDSEDPSSPEA